MVDVWTQALISAAEISNISSVLGVIVCFILMVIFILTLRVHGLNVGTSVVHVGQASPVQVNYQKVGIPFMVFLNSSRSERNELQIKLTLDVTCYLQVLWYVPAFKLKQFLYDTWESFVDILEDGEKLDAKFAEDKRIFEPLEDRDPHIINLDKEAHYISLGKGTRAHFPLVLVLKRKYMPLDNESNVGALITVIHISDDDCPMETAIIYQYLKQYSGQLTQLQTLYTQRSETNLDNEKRSLNQNLSPSFQNPFDSEFSDEGACVICRVMQPTRALLPCRHVCVCSYCFRHLEYCPLCRARISAFFLTDQIEEERQAEMREREAVSTENVTNINRHRSFLNNMNNVLNSFLGLRND